jgi:AcrR family transcriptional regulator
MPRWDPSGWRGRVSEPWFTPRVARPRATDDEQLLAAAQRLLYEVGPAEFTLARAAARAGVSAATLIKRFGSKRQLFLALNRRWVDSIGPGLAAATAGHETPLARLRAAATWGFADLDSAPATANQLATLALDLQDDGMQELLAKGWRVVTDRLTELAREAIEAGELPTRLPAEQVARILFAAAEGIRLTWCVRPSGSLVAQAEADLGAIVTALTSGQISPAFGDQG